MISGVIAEFNPFHKGHEYLLKKAGENGAVICALSGNFVQRGDTAILEKRIRAKAALLGGADVCIELPVLWSMSTAQNFALGGVSLLKNAGCDRIVFGSESGDIEELKKTAEVLLSDEFSRKVKILSESGITFAAARQQAAEGLGVKKGILNGANDNLGIEYIIAAKKVGFKGDFLAVRREGAAHDSKTYDKFVSASLLREKLSAGDFEFCSEYIPKDVMALITPDGISNIAYCDRAILSVLRRMKKEEFSALPDISEGLDNKFLSAVRVAKTLDGVYNELKVKRYTLARIRRLVLSAYIGEDSEFFLKEPPYIRVLGFTGAGEKVIKEISGKSEIPLVLRTADFEMLSEKAKKVFETECRATDLFGLTLKKPLECGKEYTAKIIKTE